MSLSRVKRQDSHRTGKVTLNKQQTNNTTGGDDSSAGVNDASNSVLSIKGLQSMGNFPQYSMNNTPSSQSASQRLQNQTQQSYEHISNSVTKQLKQATSTHQTTAMGKKSSIKSSQRKQTSQKQQALISTSNSASLVTNTNNNRVTTPMSSQDTTGGGSTSNPTNFSCLISKQMTSSNYGVGGPAQQYTTGKSGHLHNINNANGGNGGGVTRSLEKLSYKVIHNNPHTGNHSNQESKTTSQSQHNSVSLQRVVVADTTSQQSSSGGGQQYNRGSQQPQQKQKIKAFKRGEQQNNNPVVQQQSYDGKFQQQQQQQQYYGQDSSGNKNLQRLVTGTSEVSSVVSRTAVNSSTNQISQAGVKRSNGNFVSLGGIVAPKTAETSNNAVSQQKQQSLPVNSSSCLKNTGSLFAPVVTSAGAPQQQASTKVKNGAPGGSSLLSSSTGYPGQGTTGPNNGLGSKIGVFRADRLNSQRGGGQGAGAAIPPSSAKLMRPQSSNKSGTESRNAKSSAMDQQLSSSSINSQAPNLPKSKRGGRGDEEGHQKTTSQNAPGDTEASYCPKLLNLNSSQEIVLRQSSKNVQQPQYAMGHMITSPNQAHLLPGHMIKANGPNSMQASSKPANTQQNFLPPQATSQNGNVLLSASFEKLNLWHPHGSNNANNVTTKSNTSTTKQSQGSNPQQQTTLRSHQQILRQHQSNMQTYLHGATSNNPQPKTSNLKVKKAPMANKTSKTFNTPQRSKNKAANNAGVNIKDSVVILSSQTNQGSKAQAASSKAQQYLRNSFMIKHQKPQGAADVAPQSKTQGSISPRSNTGKHALVAAPGASRNTPTVVHANTSQSQSLNTSNKDGNQTNHRHSPLGSGPVLPQPMAQSFHQIAAKQKQQTMSSNPKNLNILSKGGNKTKADKQAQLSHQQKLMIDKKTYEDLMSYLVQAECKRLKHPDTNQNVVKTPSVGNNNQLLLKPSSSNSNLNSINSTKQQKRASPGSRPVVISNSTAVSGKKSKDNHLIANAQQTPSSIAFQSQQPVARPGAWQNQTSNSNQLLRAESHSQERQQQKQYTQGTTNNKQVQQQQQRLLPTSQKHHGSLPMNAASKSKVAVSSFMVVPNNVLPIQGANQKAQMLKTTISQTSQSRDASLTSHKTNGGQNVASQGKGNKLNMKNVANTISLFPGSKQNLITKPQATGAGARSGKPQQLFVKGSSSSKQQVNSSQSRNGNNLLSGITGSRNNHQNQNNTVYTVSLKSTNNLPFPDMLPQPSPNQTVISTGQIRTSGAKKGANMVATVIPTKIIKARSLIRGAAGQAPVNNHKVMMNVLKKHAVTSNNAAQQSHVETLKNNFMGPSSSNNHSQNQSQEHSVQNTSSGQQPPPKRPQTNNLMNGNRSSRAGLSDIQLKALNFPLKDRVQSAKSSSTTKAAQQNQPNQSHNQNNNNSTRVSLGRNGNNNGAQSHRESQRYFSRPSADEQHQQLTKNAQVGQQPTKMTLRQPRSTNQSQSSKERQRKTSSKQMMLASADSQSKESRKSGLSRHSNNTDNNSSSKAKRRQKATAAIKKQSQRAVMATMLPLDVMAGPENSDASAVALEQTILSGVHLIGDGIIDSRKKVKAGKKQKKTFQGVKDSCDIGVDDAMEGMIGGNFNTFGEQQAPNVFFEKEKSVEEAIDNRMVGGSENLIKRIEKQIEAELRDSKDASSALHPMFEVNELSNNSIGTHESNAIDIVAKPPQNTLVIAGEQAPEVEDDVLLQTIQSRELDPKQTLDSQVSVDDPQSNKAKLANFHYSGSFGIPDSSVASPYNDGGQLERETIAIEAAQLYEIKTSQRNTIDGTSAQKTPPGGVLLACQPEEYQDHIISEKRHTTLQDEPGSNHHKGHFQLINMSFSQENNASEHRLTTGTDQSKGKGGKQTGKKNPHNTLVNDSQILKHQSYQEYEDIMENKNNISNSSGGIKVIPSPSKKHIKKQDNTDVNDQEIMMVTEKIYSDAEYRKQLLLRVLPKFEKFEQFDELHTDFVISTDVIVEEQKQEVVQSPKTTEMAVSTGAAQLLRQINLSLGRDSSSVIQQIATNVEYEKISQIIDESIDNDRLETNTVVENECDNEFGQYIYSDRDGRANTSKGEFPQSPSVASDYRLIKSFETPSLQSPQNSTRIELQTPSNTTSALQSHYASQNTTNQHQYSCETDEHAETRLILLQSSEPESHRKQGGAFAVCSPRTAAQAAMIYEDGANGGRQAVIAMSSVRHSKQCDEEGELAMIEASGVMGIGSKDLMLPQFGCLAQGINNGDFEDEDMNQSFQTVLAGDDEGMNQDGNYYGDDGLGGPGPVTSFYGPEKPQYDEMVSIIQGDAYTMDDELMDEQTVSQIDQIATLSPYQDSKITNVGQNTKGGQKSKKLMKGTAGNIMIEAGLRVSITDGDGGSQAQSQSPHSIEQFRKVTKPIGTKIQKKQSDKATGNNEDVEQSEEDDDQFQFVQNLNKQYADAMQQRKFMKMMNRPRQNSC